MASLQREIFLQFVVDANRCLNLQCNFWFDLIEFMPNKVAILLIEVCDNPHLDIIHHPEMIDFPTLFKYLPKLIKSAVLDWTSLPGDIHYFDVKEFRKRWKTEGKKRELVTNAARNLMYRELGLKPNFSKSRGLILPHQAAMEMNTEKGIALTNRWSRIQKSALKCDNSEMAKENINIEELAEIEEICKQDKRREEKEDEYNLVMNMTYRGIQPKPFYNASHKILPQIIRSHARRPCNT